MNSENYKLIQEHKDSTIRCNFTHTMRSQSKTYDQIIAKGSLIVPDILEYLENDENNSGVSIMLLLEDIVKEYPYRPEKKEKGETVKGFVEGFFGFNVEHYRQCWINWGRKNWATWSIQQK